MDMGSLLYALNKAFPQCQHLSTLMSTNTANAHNALYKQMLCSIHKELEENLFLAMYQLVMPAFADNVEQYCKELSNSSAMHTSNTPTTSSTPFFAEELEVIE